MTIYARSTEIGIMRNVGATNWYVRIPFIIEGMFIYKDSNNSLHLPQNPLPKAHGMPVASMSPVTMQSNLL